MADGTKIEWTDATVNAVNGCSVLSPGCKNCYAMKLAGTRLKHHASRAGLTIDTKAGPVWNGTIRVNYDAMLLPLSWRRPRRLFWNAHGDLFHEAVPVETIAQVFGVAIAAYHLRGHVSQLLTKRAARQCDVLNRAEFWDEVNANASMHVMDRVDPLARRSDDARATLDDYGPDSPPPGLWIGVSVEDQVRADERRDFLRDTPASVRFVSYEPALEVVDWTGWEFLDWLISGGESGNNARYVDYCAFREARDWCAGAGVALFHKQNGVFDESGRKIGKAAAGRLLDGVEHSAMPAPTGEGENP